MDARWVPELQQVCITTEHWSRDSALVLVSLTTRSVTLDRPHLSSDAEERREGGRVRRRKGEREEEWGGAEEKESDNYFPWFAYILTWKYFSCSVILKSFSFQQHNWPERDAICYILAPLLFPSTSVEGVHKLVHSLMRELNEGNSHATIFVGH